MDMEELKLWFKDAKVMLTMTRYTEEEADIILEFFHNIRGSHERELFEDIDGKWELVHGVVTGDPSSHFNMYNSLTMRMWLYAPYILNQYSKEI